MADARRAERTANGTVTGPKVHAATKRARIDPFAPDAMKQLFARAFARMEDMLDGPMTDQDLNGAFNSTRLAAGVGKQPEAPRQFVVDMDSMLGGAPKRGDEEPPE